MIEESHQPLVSDFPDTSAKNDGKPSSEREKSLLIVLGGYLFNLVFYLILSHIYFEKKIAFLSLVQSAVALFGMTCRNTKKPFRTINKLLVLTRSMS